MSEGKERSVGSAGSVAWPSVGMISENRLRELMADVGLPHSRSLLAALRQCDMEARLDVAASLRLTDAEREALEFFGSGGDRAAARELLTVISEILGPDAAAGSRAQLMAGLIDDFNRHGDVVCNLLARLEGDK